MAWNLVDSDAVGFADGNAGHVYTVPAGAPGASDLDILCINSNTVVTTPTGFDLRVNATNSQGAYIYTRIGGSGTSITVTTSGNHNTDLIWSRWTGVNAYSTGNFARADNSNNTVLPALTTGALAETDMLLVAFGALHNHDGALATAPVWINGFTGMEAISQGTAGTSSSVAGFVGYQTNAGTASVDIGASLSWTNNVRNRYGLWVAFTGTGSVAATSMPPMRRSSFGALVQM